MASSSATISHTKGVAGPKGGNHFRPGSSPLVYRPQSSSAAQAKSERGVTWPPVYRPAPAVQAKPAAPPVYRPGANQAIASTTARTLISVPHNATQPIWQSRQNSGPHIPPPYRPFATPSSGNAAQPKIAAVRVTQPAPPVGPRLFGSTIQRSAMEIEEVESAVAEASLADLAKKIHVGSLSQSTTGIAKLNNGTMVAATQASVEAVKQKAKEEGVALADVMQTYGAGYHCEVSLYIKYGNLIKSMGASQGFCPHCQDFLSFKGITMDGPPRKTRDQVWRSPEFRAGKEVPVGATYPWVYFLDDIEGKRLTFDTKADYDEWYKKRTKG